MKWGRNYPMTDSKPVKTPTDLAAAIDRAYPRRTGMNLSVRLPGSKGTALLIDDEDVGNGGTYRAEDVIIDGSTVSSVNGDETRAQLGDAYEFVRLKVTVDGDVMKIALPAELPDPIDTVVVLEVEGEPET